MPEPQVTAVALASPAAAAGLEVGDHLVTVNGRSPRDIIEYAQLTDDPHVEVTVRRRGQVLPEAISIDKDAGQPVGLEVASPVFDRVRTCDNHCAFCFIHQLPKGMRRSLYLKDDDYRLSFLYGNFTTLTRFTELDAERVIEERLGPLYVSIHATDPATRAHLLRNPRGATSLRWLRVLLDAGIEVHGQIVVCPGINDGAVLEATLDDIADQYPTLATVGLVPLGISRYTTDPQLRPHTPNEAAAVLDAVEEFQGLCRHLFGRRLAFAADEYYLMAQRPFPGAPDYEGFCQHENGIGMAAAFAEAFRGDPTLALGARSGFFAAVDGAPATGYRARRSTQEEGPAPALDGRPVGVLTGTYGATVLAPLLAELATRRSPAPDARLVLVENTFFGGNIGVAGLLTGADVTRALLAEPEGHRYLLPDACLSEGRFLDGVELSQLPRHVEALPSDGWSLRRALEGVSAAHLADDQGNR